MSRRWIIFIVTSSNFFLSQFYRASNAVIATELLRDLSIDTKGLGLISAAFFYAFALTQIPITILLDRIGPRRMMTFLSLIGVAGALVFAGADSLYIGVVGRIMLGVGMACNLMGTLKLFTTWFDPLRFASLSGVVFSIGTAGNMAATTPLVFLVQMMGWRLSFCLIAGINFLLTALLFIVVRDRPRQTAPGHMVHGTASDIRQAFIDLRSVLNMGNYWIISIGTFASYGIFAAFQVLWAGPYLMEVLGLSAVTAGNLILLMNLGMVIGGPAWGALSDNFFRTRKKVIFWGLLVLSLIMLYLALFPIGIGIVALSCLFLLFGLFRSTGLLMYTHIKELMPLEKAGTAMTGINFFTMIGPAVFLQGLGILMQHLYPNASRGPDAFQTAFLLCAFCLACVSALYIFTREGKLES
jgi:MFS family permease